MQLISAVLTAITVAAGYYGMLYVLKLKFQLDLKQQGKWIKEPLALAVGMCALITTAILAYIRLPGFIIPQYILTMVLLCGMAALTVSDVKQKLIPNKLIIVFLLIWVMIVGITMILNIEQGLALLFRSLGGGLAGGLIFLLCYIISRGQLGAGDVKLAFVMGLYLTGERIIGGIFYGTLLCCIYSIVQLCRKKLTLKDGVPLVPFLYMGSITTLFII